MKQSKYAISKRREYILSYLRENGETKVEKLSELCQVSALTIRRDLDALEAINAVARSFGSAQLASQADGPTTFEEKETAHHWEKVRIAAEAAKYIPDGSTVFMNSGTTVLQVLKVLQDRDVTVVTNNALAYQFGSRSKGLIICTGGTYLDLTKAYVGDFASDIVSKIYADVCILGVNGISAVSGLTTSVLQETIINEKMSDRCLGKIIVVADGSKVGRTYSFVSLPIHRVDLLITDASADAEEIERLRSIGLEIVIIE